MKRWRIIVLGFVVVATIGAYFFFSPGNRVQRAVEETRQLLRQQGFKTELSEFNFSASAELRARAAVLTSVEPRMHRQLLPEGNPELLVAVETNAARVLWKQNRWASQTGEDFWPPMRDSFKESRTDLDAACDAALSGPIRFDLNAGDGTHMLLPHLAAFKNLLQSLTFRAVLELHDGNKNAAWTNLLAASRIATAYEPESVDISHLVRFACVGIAQNGTWQLLQADGWEDDRLAQLQREWESVDFFRRLPETAAFARASAVNTCQLERKEPPNPAPSLKELLGSPRYMWNTLKYYWQGIRYRNLGTYEDEKALLLHYRDRELALRRAVQSSTWSEMRQLPGVTNTAPFQSKYSSRMQTMMNSRQIGVGMQMRGQGFLGRAAEAEARRRLIITAIALERYRGRHGSYPKTLQDLSPELVKSRPTDFMDGQPLRYHPTSNGHFVLYSVGLDCVDNGGTLERSEREQMLNYRSDRVVKPMDLVWPRPASVAECERFDRKQIAALAERTDRDAEMQAAEQWRRTASRQARVEKILAAKPGDQPKEPVYRDRPLGEVLRNEKTSGTNSVRLEELLKLKQIITGDEPEIITFNLPIVYDIVTNIAELGLLVDPSMDEDSDAGCWAEWLECRRATNGNCLLIWNTIYESAGKHALQMALHLNEPPSRNEAFFVGPLAALSVSNLCQFSLSSATFNPDIGATLHAKLVEPQGTYTVELTSQDGKLLKTITGNTSNGIIKERWDLTDDHGQRCTNLFFNSIFHITLPDSGRTQTLKGP